MAATSEQTVTAYAGCNEHAQDLLERVRLVLARAMARLWPRLVDTGGRLSDLFVSALEAQLSIQGLDVSLPPPDGAGWPSVGELEDALDALDARIAARLALAAEEDPARSFPLENLRSTLRLSNVVTDVVVVLFALQRSVALHRLACFTWADFTIKQPTLGFLADVVAWTEAERAEVLAMGAPSHPVRQLRLVTLSEDERWRGGTPPLHLRALLPDRMSAYLCGAARRWSEVRGYEGLGEHCSLHPAGGTLADMGQSEGLAQVLHDAGRQAARSARGGESAGPAGGLAAHAPTVVLTGPWRDEQPGVLAAVYQRPVLRVDLASSAIAPADLAPILAIAAREALLRDALLLVQLPERDDDTVRGPLLAALFAVLPLIEPLAVISTPELDAGIRRMLGPCGEVRLEAPTVEARLRLWQDALGLGSSPGTVPARSVLATSRTLADVAHRYTLGAHDIRDAAARALLLARLRHGRDGVTPAELHQAVRQRVAHRLGTMAEIFSTPLTWDDLVLESDLREELREIAAYVRNEQQVMERWGFGRLTSYGRGLSALFEGPPGTGKTICAAILAREFGRELFRVDLSRIVDKFIGETEKHLARVFDEAERSHAVLLFDEADSLFGKRTEVRSSNDRYANLEVNFLLQRMESFSGITILTTNLGTGIDEAFQRRIRFKLSFRLPGEADREQLWRSMIPPEAPVEGGIAWAQLAKGFAMAPGHIKNAVLRAAFQAAREGGPVTFDRLWAAAAHEYRALGNLVRDAAPPLRAP